MRINRWRKFLSALILMPVWLPLLLISRVMDLIEDIFGVLFGNKWFWFER